MEFKLFTDGGSRGNPGPAGIGAVLLVGGAKVAEVSEYIGEATNNVAEYRALLRGLDLAVENNAVDLECYLDSELVVKQLNGQYRVKDANLQRLFAQVKNYRSKFNSITFAHVSRDKNAVSMNTSASASKSIMSQNGWQRIQ